MKPAFAFTLWLTVMVGFSFAATQADTGVDW